MNFKTFDKITILILTFLAAFFAYAADAYGVNVERYQCPEIRPFIIYVINEDGSLRAVIGTDQFAFLMCQGDLCSLPDAVSMESYLYDRADEAGIIRKIQLP